GVEHQVRVHVDAHGLGGGHQQPGSLDGTNGAGAARIERERIPTLVDPLHGTGRHNPGVGPAEVERIRAAGVRRRAVPDIQAIGAADVEQEDAVPGWDESVDSPGHVQSQGDGLEGQSGEEGGESDLHVVPAVAEIWLLVVEFDAAAAPDAYEAGQLPASV